MSQSIHILVILFTCGLGISRIAAGNPACPAALSRGLAPHSHSVSYPHYVRDQNDQLWREELTPIYDHIADMLVTSRVHVRSVPKYPRSAIAEYLTVPLDILAQMNLDDIGRDRVRLAHGVVEGSGLKVLITDLDGDLRVFHDSDHKPYHPKQKTFIKTFTGHIVRMARFPLAFDVTIGRIAWKTDVLPKDYVSPIVMPDDLISPIPFGWMVGAHMLEAAEVENMTVARGTRRGNWWTRYENIPVYVFDIGGDYLVIDQDRYETLKREYINFGRTSVFELLAFRALRAPKIPVHLQNGKTLVLKVLPHPDDPKFFTKGYSI